MSNLKLFLDTNVLLSGSISTSGVAHSLLILGEGNIINLFISEQVVVEFERNFVRKVPSRIFEAREIILQANISILSDPNKEDLIQYHDWIHHKADLPILIAAFHAHIDFFVTLNRKHFIDDPKVAIKSGLRIGTPGDSLEYVRQYITNG